MATVTVILGLSGSGKSYFLDQMVGVERFEEGLLLGTPEWQRFMDALSLGNDCGVIEIRYLNEFGRRQLTGEVLLLYPDTVFNWICFENDLEAANWNCRNDPKRNAKEIAGHIANNEQWATLYEYPKGAVVLKIFRLPELPA